jgi:hypothetical protein
VFSYNLGIEILAPLSCPKDSYGDTKEPPIGIPKAKGQGKTNSSQHLAIPRTANEVVE